MKQKRKTGRPVLIQVMLPKDMNVAGTIHGGVILTLMDSAGAIAAKKLHRGSIVTVCVKEVVFKQPVLVADIVSLWACVATVGRTSITTRIVVEVERVGKKIAAAEGEIVYVAIDPEGRPTPVSASDRDDPHNRHLTKSRDYP